MLGAAWIARRAVLPALDSAHGCEVVAIASRDRARAEAVAREHGIARVHDSYEGLIADPEVDAIYLPLVNSLHRDWTLRALAEGKHVLCEKPLAMSAAEAEEMAAAAERAGLKLMEAFMYRFHPRLRAFLEKARQVDVVRVEAAFGFPLADSQNYRLVAELGGGALRDTGCYCVNAVRQVLGEPLRVAAVGHLAGGVDWTAAAELGFEGGATASIWASFESPERQELVVVAKDGERRLPTPFTSWRDPDDPYRLMCEGFAEAVRSGAPVPVPLEDSIANLRVLDGIAEQLGSR